MHISALFLIMHFFLIFCTLSYFVLSDKHSPFTANSKNKKKKKRKNTKTLFSSVS